MTNSDPASARRARLLGAVLETAAAYYWQNPEIQYDSNEIVSGIGRSGGRMLTSYTPECAGTDSLIYTVCSDYAYRVYMEALGFPIAPSQDNCFTQEMVERPLSDPMVVYKYGGADGETDGEKAVREAQAMLRAGDIIVYYEYPEPVGHAQRAHGHALLCVGDYFGDGMTRILHSTGGKFNPTTGHDRVEVEGSIYNETTEDILFRPSDDRKARYLASFDTFVILRPLDAAEKSGVRLTAAAEARLRFPKLMYRRELRGTQFGRFTVGGEAAVTVTVQNHSDAPYHGLPLTEKLPAGQTLLSCTTAGERRGDDLVFCLDVPAKSAVTITYTLRLSGACGDTVVFPAGAVASDIPTRRMELKLGGAGLTGVQQAALYRLENETLPAALTERFCDLDSVNLLYAEVLGIRANLPATVRELLSLTLVETDAPASEARYLRRRSVPDGRGAELQKMLLPKHLAGKYVYEGADFSTRVLEYRAERYLAGDVFVGFAGAGGCRLTEDAEIVIQIVLGCGRVLTVTKDGTVIGDFDTTCGYDLRLDVLMVLRPSMAVPTLPEI